MPGPCPRYRSPKRRRHDFLKRFFFSQIFIVFRSAHGLTIEDHTHRPSACDIDDLSDPFQTQFRGIGQLLLVCLVGELTVLRVAPSENFTLVWKGDKSFQAKTGAIKIYNTIEGEHTICGGRDLDDVLSLDVAGDLGGQIYRLVVAQASLTVGPPATAQDLSLRGQENAAKNKTKISL